MPREILYFTEYSALNEDGVEVSPYIENNHWVWDQKKVTLKEMGRICGLDEREMVMLRIKYACD